MSMFRPFHSVRVVTKALFTGLSRIWNLAQFEYKIMYRSMRLGVVWVILSQVLQIGVYWFVFGIGIRRGAPVDGFSYVEWLVTGVSIWFFSSASVRRASNALREKASVLSKVSILPCLTIAGKVLAAFIEHIWLVIVMLGVLLLDGWLPNPVNLCLLYYCLCTICFSVAFGMVYSYLVLLAADFKRVLDGALRLMFFLTPIFWNLSEAVPSWYVRLQSWNPFCYLVTGYRDSLLYLVPFWNRGGTAAIFWSTVLILYLAGCQLQVCVRNRLADTH